MHRVRFLPVCCFVVSILFACAASPSALRAQPAGTDLETEEQKTLYVLGVALAQQLTSFRLSEQELAIVLEGLRDKALGAEPRVDVQAYGAKLEQLVRRRLEAAAEAEKQASKAFLDKMASEPGAARTESGLIYTEMAAGSGSRPGPTDRVRVHYHGTLRDGTVFDSSIERGQPAEFSLDGVIPCWTEGLQLMRVGGMSRLVCPSEISYGDQGRQPQIPGGSALVFHVELLEIISPGDG